MTCPTPMLKDYTDPCALLQQLTDAYAGGDMRLAERLFMQALEDDLSLDEVCAAATCGIALYHGEKPGA